MKELGKLNVICFSSFQLLLRKILDGFMMENIVLQRVKRSNGFIRKADFRKA